MILGSTHISTNIESAGVQVEDKPRHAVRSFLIELSVYSGLVVAYVFLVIRLLGNWLGGLFEHSKAHYAIAALLLIIGQGVLLEMVTSLLLKIVRRRTE
jgi:hypothetical protein